MIHTPQHRRLPRLMIGRCGLPQLLSLCLLCLAPSLSWSQLNQDSQPSTSPEASEPESAVADAQPATADPPREEPAGLAATEEPQSGKSLADQPRLRFNFRFAPWEEVLTWLADEADLSLQLDSPPPGTFNYADRRTYTTSEAIDLINGVLLTRGFTLLRRDRMLTIVNLEDEIPPMLIELVPPEKLDERGQFELVRTVFPLSKMTAEQAELEITRLVGPQGSVVALPTARQVMVTETAGRLRMIREMLDRVQNPAGSDQVTELALKHIGADEALEIARPLLGLAEGVNTGEEISISVDPFGSRLFATGSAEKLEILNNLVQRLDVPLGGPAATAGNPLLEVPQLLTYQIQAADPTTVHQVLQTLLAGRPDVRLQLDLQSKKLVALARPAEHATIRATLAELEGEADQTEVIQLRRLDPQMVVLTINKLFGSATPTADGQPADGLRIDGNPTTKQLFVHGTRNEIEKVRDLVQKLEADDSLAQRGTVRVLPFAGGSAQSALQSVQLLWPTLRNNRVRVVTPSATVPAMRGTDSRVPQRTLHPDASTAPGPSTGLPADRLRPTQPSTPDPQPASTRSTEHSSSTPTVLVSQRTGADPETDENDQQDEDNQFNDDGQLSDDRYSDIIVSFTPQGMVIASEDTEALDEFESLLRTMNEGAGAEQLPTVFWLKYARADLAASLLNQIINGGSTFTSTTSTTLDTLGGGLLGSALAPGGVASSGPMSIIPDVRLNALIVHGSPADLALVDQLLRVIDQESSPEEVETAGRPRLIPVIYNDAETMANVLRQVYADRIVGNESQQRGGGSSGGGRPSPEDFFRMMRGDRDDRGGDRGGDRSSSSSQARSEPPKMTIGVDPHSNSLIVSAPEPLFREVEQLVNTLDHAGIQANEMVEVVTVQGAINPDYLQKALQAILGADSVRQADSPATTSSRSSSSSTGSSQPSSEDFRQRMEMFRSMRERAEREGGGGFFGSGRPGSGGFGSGGGGFGGRSDGDSRREGGSDRGGDRGRSRDND